MPMSTPRRNITSLMFCSGPLPTIGSTRSRSPSSSTEAEILDDGKVGAARAAGHDRHDVLVDARAEVLAQVLTGGSDAGVGLGLVLGARRRRGGKGDQTESDSEGDTHDRSLF